jgi:hypothetical protein
MFGVYNSISTVFVPRFLSQICIFMGGLRILLAKLC